MFVFFSSIATPRHQIILPYPANNRVIKHGKYVVIDIKLIYRIARRQHILEFNFFCSYELEIFPSGPLWKFLPW